MVTGIVLGFYVLFGRVASWSLAVTLSLLLGRKQQVGWSLVMVVLVGILEDVARAQPFGVSSLFLVGVFGLVWVIERHYRGQWVWWYVVGFLSELVFHILMGKIITWESLVGQLVALWLVRWLLARVGQPEGIYVG